MWKQLEEKWKNRETKRRLKEENLKLREQIETFRAVSRPHIYTVERSTLELRSSIIVDFRDLRCEEDIKHMIAHKLVNEMYPFIEWNFGNTFPNGREFSGSVCLAVKK